MKKGFFSAFVIYTAVSLTPFAFAQTGEWKQQPIQGGVPGLWAVSMKDTGNGIASGITDLGSNISGVLRKTAGDPTWYPVPLGNFTPAIPGNFTAWYGASAFSGSQTMYICGNNSKVYKSTDDGVNWTQQTSGIGVSKTLFGMYFSNTSTGMVVGDDGVAFYTTNGGTSWTPQTTGTTQTLLAVHSSGGIWYASGTNNTILKFTPPSAWTPLSVAPHNAFGQALADVKFVGGATGFTSGGNALLSGNVLYTNSSGASWSNLNVPNQGAPYLFNAMWWFSISEGWAANVFDAIYYTSNGGTNWTRYSAIPTVGAGGGVTEMSFPSHDIGYGSGGAIGGGSGTSGWIIRWQPVNNAPIIATNDTLKFGTLACGSARDISFVVFNVGNAPLNIPAGGFVFSSPDFSFVGPALPQSIPASGQTDFTIRWTPAQGFNGPIPPGTTLTIQSNDPANPNWIITLEGTRNAKRVHLADSHLIFTSICASQYTDLIVQGTPQGADPQFIKWVHASGDDGISILTPAPGAIVNAPTDFTFRHVPTGTGMRTGSYYFISGDPACPDTAVITFEGGVRQSMIDFPATLDFGPACTEHELDIVLDLLNSGAGPAQLLKREFVSGRDLFPDVMGTPWGPVTEGNTLPYTFRFRPGQNDTGAVSGTYRYILGPCPDTVTVTFTGYGVKQSIVILPTNVLVLGPTPVGGQNDAQIFVRNNSGVPVEIATIRLTPAHPSITWVNLPALPHTILPGEELVLDIRYQPIKIETLSATVCVKYTSPCIDSLCIAVTASSSDPPTIVVQNSLDMGVQRCEPPIRDTLPVFNAGPGILSLTDILIGGAEAAHFRVIEPASFPLDIFANDTGFVILEYNRPTEGASVAQLLIKHNDPKTAKLSTVGLTGRREVYRFAVEGDTISTLTACYGSVATRKFTLRNTEAHTVQIISIGIDQAVKRFAADIIAMPNILQPGDSLVVTITMDTDFVGPAQGTLRIVSEPCMYTREIVLHGEVQRASLAFTPAEMDFGNVSAGSSSDIGVDVRNTGLAGVVIDSMVLVPASSEFSLVNPPGFPVAIPVNSGIQITGRYAPQSGAGLSGTLCAYISQPCPDTICIDVSGTSNTDVLAADRTVVDIFLDPCTVSKSCQSVTVKNFSTVSHTVDAVSLSQSGTIFTVSRPQTTPLTVNPGAEFIVEVCAAGIFTGADTAIATVTTSTGAAPVVIRFIALRDSVNLIIPAYFELGVMARCQSEFIKGFPVWNTGTAADTLDVAGGVKSPFSLASAVPFAVPAGASATFDIRFATTMYSIFSDTLVLRSRRCGRTYRIILNGSYLARNLEILPDPLAFGNVQRGASLTKQFAVTNMNIRGARISAILFSAPEFTTTSSTPILLDTGKVAVIPVRFSPLEQRDYTGTICIVIDQPCDDTICINVTGSGIEGQLQLTPTELAYDSVPQCHVRIDTIGLQNIGSAAVSLDSARIEGPGAPAFTILNPVAGTEVLAPGFTRYFYLEFNAALIPAGPVQAVLAVFTNDPKQPRLETQLTGARVTMAVQQQLSLDFGTIQAGTPAIRTLTVTNNGQTAFTYSSASLPAGIALAPPLPVTLLPGESINFDVTLTALQAGPLQTSFTLLVNTPCIDSTVVTCTAEVAAGITIIGAIAAPVASCDTVTMYVLMHNPLGVAVTVDDIRIEGLDAAWFSVLSPGVPRTIPAGDSLVILIRFTPDPARGSQYSAECVVRVIAGGVSSDLRASLIASVVIPRLTLLGVPDFGGVAVDDPPGEITVSYVNNGPFPLRIETALFDDPALSVVSTTPALPAMLAPGDTLTMLLRFLPVNQGGITSTLAFSISDPCVAAFTTVYTATGLPPNIIAVDIEVAGHTGAVDDRVIIPVRLNSDLGSEGIDGWSVGLEFNRMMLFPLSVIKEGTLSSQMDVGMDWDFETETLRLSGANAPLNPGTGELVRVEFLVLIGDNLLTSIEIQDSVWLNTTDRIALTRKTGSFTLVDYCVAGGKRLISASGRNFLAQPSPNPFATTTQVRYEVASDGYVEIHVYNMLGLLVKTLVASEMKKGEHSVTFNADGLPTGNYLVSMKAGNFTHTRMVVISK